MKMTAAHADLLDLSALKAAFGEQLQLRAPLARYTAARVGGPAEALVEVHTADELAQSAARLWQLGQPFVVLGGGSNVLISDLGIDAVVVLNRARRVCFEDGAATVWAESGANFGVIARQAAQRGLSGLEWAAGIPGTLGGAVVGNAGAHGGNLAGNLLVAEILHHAGQGKSPVRQEWLPERFEFSYRTSRLKRQPGQALVLSAKLQLQPASASVVQARMDQFLEHRRRTQPPGASMGSMFKNPPGDFAGRLIEAVGLKGTRSGGAEISSLHANFFLNQGQATAQDVYHLIQIAHQAVLERFGIDLELEIELLGRWDREAMEPVK